MKKHVLFIAAILAFNNLNAQSFPNGGFENWVTQPNFEDPQHWISSNFLTSFGTEPTAVKSTDAHSGTYALKVKSIIHNAGGENGADTTSGLMMLGSMDYTNASGYFGYPFAHRPDSLVGWYKLNSPDNSPFYLEFGATKWNAATGEQELIGEASYHGDPSSTYQRFSIPITYSGNEFPDSIQALIIPSKDDLNSLSELYLDDLSFVYNPTSTAAILEHTAHIQMYPNPVNTVLNIESDLPVQYLQVKDLSGKPVFGTGHFSDTFQLETGDFSSGIYFCELHFSNGTFQQFKFVKQ